MPPTNPRTNCASRMSPQTTSTLSRQRASSSQPQVLNELYCASARTCAPLSTSISTRCEPIDPSAPVTTTFLPARDAALNVDGPGCNADGRGDCILGGTRASSPARVALVHSGINANVHSEPPRGILVPAAR